MDEPGCAPELPKCRSSTIVVGFAREGTARNEWVFAKRQPPIGVYE